MSTHRKTLEKKCHVCGSNIDEVHMKNPYIDDFTTECPKCEPGTAVSALNAWARSAAKAEYESERNHSKHDEEE